MAKDAGRLACPSCGAPASPESSRCEHCATVLALVACPSCFGRIFKGARFCSHCGAAAERADPAARPERQCPRCRQKLAGIAVGAACLDECAQCGGVWAERADLERILAASESKADVAGMPAGTGPPLTRHAAQAYVPCAACGRLMNRFNFARTSGVIVDVCKPHGTWFDRDELQRLVTFVQGGGMARARQRERENLAEEVSRLRDQQQTAARLAARAPGAAHWTHDDHAAFGVTTAMVFAAAALFEMFGDS